MGQKEDYGKRRGVERQRTRGKARGTGEARKVPTKLRNLRVVGKVGEARHVPSFWEDLGINRIYCPQKEYVGSYHLL